MVVGGSSLINCDERIRYSLNPRVSVLAPLKKAGRNTAGLNTCLFSVLLIDTSQLSNSNKWFSYREAYLMMPLLLTLTGPSLLDSAGFAPASAATSVDYAMGFKNWFGTMIHSMTLDMNGTTGLCV